jgi:hypothetical protein
MSRGRLNTLPFDESNYKHVSSKIDHMSDVAFSFWNQILTVIFASRGYVSHRFALLYNCTRTQTDFPCRNDNLPKQTKVATLHNITRKLAMAPPRFSYLKDRVLSDDNWFSAR